jgi:Bacterial Ig-like domain (group 3)
LISACMLGAAVIASGQDQAVRAHAGLPPIERSQIRTEGAISLEPATGWDLQIHAFDSKGNRLPEAPANFRRLGEVTTGENSELHTLTLRFSQTVTILHIESTPDFPIEPGGSCVEGSLHVADTTCTLAVRFTPQGPGTRLGHLLVTHSVSDSGPITMAFGLGGYGYAAVINFIPSTITTVAGSYPSGVGLLKGAKNLTVDGGDTLYIADSGNGDIRYLDSSGAIKTLVTGATNPYGIAVDTFGNVFFDNPANQGFMYEIYNYATFDVLASGTGTDVCTASTSPLCSMGNEQLYAPGEMSIDRNNNLIFANENIGAALSTLQPTAPTFMNLYSPFTYQEAVIPDGFAADADDNLYSLWAINSECEIQQQSLYNAENSYVIFNKVAGGRYCGFSGDGGLAGNAEIGSVVGQITFDAAGNMYFSDTNNQRVRRIDYSTGIIRTIAGSGVAGYTGDGGRATLGELNAPSGVGVDSQGNVYIISSAATGQVVRKVGSPGLLAFGNQVKATASAAQLVTVTNTGNSTMTLTNAVITGANAGAFKVDNTTTTCVLTSGASLYTGQTCRIGVIFTPAAVGAASATLTLLDNTANGADAVTLTGTGVLPTPTFKITAPANQASVTSGTAVTFSVSVTSTSGAQPTGTIQFKVDGTNHGTAVTLSSTGTASTSITGLSVASHTLSATYSGDANYAAAGPVSVSITVTAPAVVKFTAPTVAQVAAPTTDIPLSVSITASEGPAPTGKVKFSVDGKALATVPVDAGKASTSSGTLAAGSHTFVAAYSGDKYHHPAAVSKTITVSP